MLICSFVWLVDRVWCLEPSSSDAERAVHVGGVRVVQEAVGAFLSLRTSDFVPVKPTPVITLFTPGPLRWMSWIAARSCTRKR